MFGLKDITGDTEVKAMLQVTFCVFLMRSVGLCAALGKTISCKNLGGLTVLLSRNFLHRMSFDRA